MGSRVAGVVGSPPRARGPLALLADPSQERFGVLARRLRLRADLIHAAAVGSLRGRAAGLATPSDGAVGRVEELIRDLLAAQLDLFASAAPPRRLPAERLIAGPLLAEDGEFELLLFAFRALHLSLWDAWFALVEGAPDLDAHERRALLARGSGLFFSYAGLLSARAVEVFRRESEARRLAPDHHEVRAVRALLAGDALAAASLRFDFARHHLGLIAWEAEDPLAPLADLARALARPLFTIRPPECPGECWAWLSGTRPLSAREEELLAGWRPPAGRVAIGLEGFGEAGFRAGHRQAARARRLAAPGSPLVRYADVAVEALATENEADARAFLAHELGGIDDDSPTSLRLRETLLAWFACEQNAASAAARLGVHQQTVANRLRTAEEILGHVSIGSRRLELELALRLHARLPGSATDPSSAPVVL
ncbi:MAG: helix-turn-helix domain-containing protein [Actinobacteria bacterium]|nr:helix-turn-helix domain-containing protein [Actinomycetota bacterium]